MEINPQHYFILSDGRTIKSLEELADWLKTMPEHVFTHHVTESKNDFANWIRYVFGSKKLADAILPYTYKERKKIISSINDYLREYKVLVINAGSSSIKFQLIELTRRDIITKGVIDAIGLDRCALHITIHGEEKIKPSTVKNHDEAMRSILQTLFDEEIIGTIAEIRAVGHRVVHGGELFTSATRITPEVLERLGEISNLAPLHNPANISCIRACQLQLPVPHVAVFDTAFHATIPQEKYLYGLPYTFYEQHKIRKYGFHGSSHKYITGLMKEYYKLKKKKNANIIICHLGNGASITAVKNWKSINTTMGFTPMDGLIMGTRCGSLDPAVGLHLQEQYHLDYTALARIFNKESGLLGISGHADMRDIHKNQKDSRAKLALDMFCDRIIHYIGAYVAELGGVDGIIFTAGIGENAHYVRKKVLEQFKFLGLKLDEKKNTQNEFMITSKDSRIEVFVIPTNEELQIATEVRALLK